jgi:peptidylprolyl isomerase
MSDRVPPADPTLPDPAQPRAGGATAAAYQPTVVERQAAGRGRGQALIGAAAGLAVIAVLVGVFVWAQNADDDPAAVAGQPVPAASAPQAPAEQPPSAPTQPSGPPVDPALSTKPTVTAGTGTVDKLVVKPLVTGTGPKVTAGQTLTVNYVGVLYSDGKEFDASWKTGQPAQFPIGVGQVIKGWDQGLVGVPVGSRVQLDIPAALAYGDPAPAGYPEGALRFVVDILGAQ